MDTNRLIFTVSQLNSETSHFLKQSFSNLWLEGEVSNLTRPNSGHLYFTLKDANAQLRCAMFRNRYRNTPSIDLKNGQKIIAFGNVGLYEPRGDYQFIVSSIEEAGTGKLQQQFELLKQKLNEAGLFAQEHKKTLPRFIQDLAVVTSPTGAAIQDILNVLKRRSPHIAITIYPVAVQGQEATPQIIHAINQANQNHTHDALLLARGGGSIEDLWAFNEEAIAQAIFASKLPVVTGIGHEIDFTIADFASDQRAPTPSAAAELVSIDTQQWQQTLKQYEQRLQQAMLKKNQQLQHTLEYLQQRLSTQHPSTQLEQKAQRIDELETRLQQQMQKHIQYKQNQLHAQVAQLQALSPLATLERGYSLAYKNKKLITQTKQIKVGQSIQVKLSDGEVSCEVQAIQPSSTLRRH